MVISIACAVMVGASWEGQLGGIVVLAWKMFTFLL